MTAEQYLAPDGRVYEKEDGEWIWKNDNVSESIQKNIVYFKIYGILIM